MLVGQPGQGPKAKPKNRTQVQLAKRDPCRGFKAYLAGEKIGTCGPHHRLSAVSLG